MTRPFYLQLHFDVWDDPAIRQLPATTRCAIVDLLKYAVRSSEPGIITIAMPQLARMLGYRKMERFEALLQTLEDRRLIAWRKEDDALVVNPDLIPQLAAPGTRAEFPRRRHPSDEPEATRARKRLSRQSVRQMTLPTDVTMSRGPNIAEAEPEPEREQQQAEPARSTSAQDAAADVAPAQSATHEIGARLMAAGVTARVAVDLQERHGPTECAAQLEYLPFRTVERPAAALVRAIAERWAPPDGWRQEQERKEATAARQNARQKAERAHEADKAEQARRAQDIASAKATMTAAQRQELRARAAERISAFSRERLEKGDDHNPITRAEIEAAEWQIIKEAPKCPEQPRSTSTSPKA